MNGGSGSEEWRGGARGGEARGETLGARWNGIDLAARRNSAPPRALARGARRAAYLLAYNLVHALMARAAARQGVGVERISSADALRWMLHAAPDEALCDLVINPRALVAVSRARSSGHGTAGPACAAHATPTARQSERRLSQCHSGPMGVSPRLSSSDSQCERALCSNLRSSRFRPPRPRAGHFLCRHRGRTISFRF